MNKQLLGKKAKAVKKAILSIKNCFIKAFNLVLKYIVSLPRFDFTEITAYFEQLLYNFFTKMSPLVKAFKDLVKKTKCIAARHGKMEGFVHFKNETLAFMRKNKKPLKKLCARSIAVLAIIAVFSVATSLNNVTLAYEVICDGEIVGYAANENVVAKASKLVAEHMDGDVQMTTSPVVNVVLVQNDQIANASELSEKIIENSSEIANGSGLYVNGKFVVAANSESIIKDALNKLLDNEKVKYESNDAEFVDEIEFYDGVFNDKEILRKTQIEEKLNELNLEIKTTKYSVVEKTIDYVTFENEDNTKSKDYKNVTLKGQNGLVRAYVCTYYINGKPVSETVMSSEVVKEVIDETVTVGTKDNKKSTTKKKTVKKSSYKKQTAKPIETDDEYVWPVARVSSSYVSQRFGYHTGVDIAAYRGTQIYAAMGGTVTEVQYSNRSYGNRIYIKCPNGLTMLYAHCDTIGVKTGDVVTTGQPIATVGDSGNATGPHLHFEVRRNGTYLNPANYIGSN